MSLDEGQGAKDGLRVVLRERGEGESAEGEARIKAH